MPVDIRTIPKLEAQEYNLGGRLRIRLAPVSAGEVAAIMEQLPPPTTTSERRSKSDEFKGLRRRWNTSKRVAFAGVAAGLPNAAGELWTAARSSGWVSAWVDHLLTSFSEPELLEMLLAAELVSAGAPAERIATEGGAAS